MTGSLARRGPKLASFPWPLGRLLGLGMLLGLWACGAGEPPAEVAMEIPVVAVIERDQPIEIEMVGETRGSSDIPIRTRVEGVVLGMHFTEGRKVAKGDLLYTIDASPFEAKVVEAEGQVAEARTKLAKAWSDLRRTRPLAAMNAVSQVDLDSAVALHEAALGALKSAEARLEQARIELGYTRIHSPIDGRVGISQARVGEFVGKSPNPVVLNYVSQTNPIRVRFSIDERRYLKLARRFRNLEQVDAREESKGLELILADGSIHEHRGRLVASDAAVDPTTGTFTLEADFPNPDDLVLAGQFARVRGVVEIRQGGLLLPQRAISELQGNFRVYVVGEDGRVELRTVVPGPKIEALQIIDSGLEAGERVALEFMRLRDGARVVPKLQTLDASGNLPKAAAGSDSGA